MSETNSNISVPKETIRRWALCLLDAAIDEIIQNEAPSPNSLILVQIYIRISLTHFIYNMIIIILYIK